MCVTLETGKSSGGSTVIVIPRTTRVFRLKMTGFGVVFSAGVSARARFCGANKMNEQFVNLQRPYITRIFNQSLESTVWSVVRRESVHSKVVNRMAVMDDGLRKPMSKILDRMSQLKTNYGHLRRVNYGHTKTK